MIFVIGYFVAGFLTMVGQAIVEKRAGSEDWAWWLIIWPLGLMWPLCFIDAIWDLIDGPYEPRHREYWI